LSLAFPPSRSTGIPSGVALKTQVEKETEMKYQALAAALALSAQAAHLTAQSQSRSQQNAGGGAPRSAARPTIVLVHGGFVDGSGWAGVFEILRKDGYNVAIVQNPTISLAGDVAAARSVINAQAGPVILVGHSYGGAVITEAGNDPKVVGLVYITAFAPDNGESVRSSRIPRLALRSRQFFHRAKASSISTRRSSPPRSQPMSSRKPPRSWPNHRYRGDWTLSTEASRKQRGEQSPAGT
jgi:pimeloyl-ACP methyl ester carboxylesterase